MIWWNFVLNCIHDHEVFDEMIESWNAFYFNVDFGLFLGLFWFFSWFLLLSFVFLSWIAILRLISLQFQWTLGVDFNPPIKSDWTWRWKNFESVIQFGFSSSLSLILLFIFDRWKSSMSLELVSSSWWRWDRYLFSFCAVLLSENDLHIISLTCISTNIVIDRPQIVVAST